MRWAIPTSVAVHLGLIAGAWLFLQLTPEDITLAEAAVSIEIVSTEESVTEPSETVAEESVNLVSAGMTQAASEPEVTEAVEPAEVATALPAQPVAAATPVTETLATAATETLASAEVLTALPTTDAPVAAPIPLVTADTAPTVAETVAPSDAPVLERLDQAARLTEVQPTEAVQEITTASINPLTPVEPVQDVEPVKIANLSPMPEPIVEEAFETAPVPAPRIVRKPVAADAKPVEEKPAEKPARKPVEKKPKQVATLGNGGEAEADSAAAKAAGGSTGKVVSAGKGTIDAYEGKVRAKFLKALRKPKDAKRGEVRVIFRLDANGRVIKSKLSRSSGDDRLDQAALAAIERAAPYPPIPAGAGKSTWDITIPIGIN